MQFLLGSICNSISSVQNALSGWSTLQEVNGNEMISLLGKTCEEFQFVGGTEKCGECALRLMEEMEK